MGVTAVIIHFNGILPNKNHPFWGTPNLGHLHVSMLWWVIIPTYPYFLLMNLKYIGYIPNYISTIHAIAYDFPSRKAKKKPHAISGHFRNLDWEGLVKKAPEFPLKR